MNEENQLNGKIILNQLKDKIEEINILKEKISELESINSSLNNKIFDLNIKLKIYSEIEAKNKTISEEKKLYENQIEQLKSEILNITRKNKEEKRLMQKELESEIILYKGLHESGLGKVLAAEKIFNLNNFQQDYIEHLEQQIQNLRKQNDENISKLKLEYDIHIYNFKQSMAKYLKDVHNCSKNKYNQELQKNSKLYILYKNEMLNELEKEALLIKELIKEKEKNEKINFECNQELNLQKKINRDLFSKNIKYLNIIKNINIKYPNSININSINNNSFSEKKKKKFNKYKLKFTLQEPSEEIKQKQEKIIKNIIRNNIYRGCLTNKNYHQDKNNKKYLEEYISLKKSYEELIKENKDIKEQLSTLKDKQKMIYNKFSGILNLYNNALNLLLQEEDLKINNIIINKELIENGNYEQLTSLEKYILVMLLIKQILPLLKTSIEENDNLNIYKDEINLDKLSKFNFRSVFDKTIDICDNNIIDLTKEGRNKKNKFLKNFNSETNINNHNKIKTLIKNKSFTQNKRLKIFKEIKGKYRPIRFIHIENKFNFNIKSDKDISLTKNKFFE